MDTVENYDLSALREQLMALLGDDAKHYPKQIEQQFPRILSQIVTQWGKVELDNYFSELMVPARAGRHGFPHEVAMEIFHLANLHSALNLSPTPSGTGWAGIDDPERFKKALSREG